VQCLQLLLKFLDKPKNYLPSKFNERLHTHHKSECDAITAEHKLLKLQITNSSAPQIQGFEELLVTHIKLMDKPWEANCTDAS